jgi:hypothetical protein
MIILKDKLIKVGNGGIVGMGIKGHPVHRQMQKPLVNNIINDPMARMSIGSGFVSTTQLKRKPINFL